MFVTAIIAAGGAGQRLGAGVPKQLLDVGGVSILQRSVEAFAGHPEVDEVIVALPPDLVDAPPLNMSDGLGFRSVAGGARRQDSVANAFRMIDAQTDVVLVHDAARPFVTDDLISKAIQAAAEHGAAIVAQPVSDTVKRVRREDGRLAVIETIPRESIFLAQTPQAFRVEVLADAIALGESGTEATDEAALAERAGHAVHIVEATGKNVKITTTDDLAEARRRFADEPIRIMAERVGTGYDLHRLVEGRPLLLGGVQIPAPRGAMGHSDADVVCHAATDAILGAASLGDIGRHFPDSDPQWKGASSLDLLQRAVAMVHTAGFRVVNLDVVVVLERPKITPYIDLIRLQLARVLEVPVERVSAKGKTNEGVDAVGRGEAIAAHAVALLALRHDRGADRRSAAEPLNL
jgi:2-C-methyl-D-erythritol 4-phosphate cytidylyltransferase/2-C-methyl-D-erythritol 2,4-cyclodiphosphate synthase